MPPITCTSEGLRTHLSFAAQPSAVSCARGHVRTVACEWGLPDLCDTAELLVSELMTNAVQASRYLNVRADVPFVAVVHLWVTSDRIGLSIFVWDASSEMPTRRHGALDEEGGRGLMLVEALGKDWGSYRKDGGKVVWVQITGDP